MVYDLNINAIQILHCKSFRLKVNQYEYETLTFLSLVNSRLILENVNDSNKAKAIISTFKM